MLTQSQIIYSLVYASLGSILVLLGVGVLTWQHQPKPLRFFVLGLVGYLLFFLLSILLNKQHINNIFTQYLSSGNDILFFSLCFGLAVKNQHTKRLIFIIAGLTLLGLIVGPLLLKYYSVDSASTTVEVIAVSAVVYLYINDLVKNTQAASLWHVPLFWIAIAKLSICVISIPYDIFLDQLNKYNVQLSLKILLFTYGFTIVCNVVYAVGLWKSRKYGKVT
jgi:hypothetical protein